MEMQGPEVGGFAASTELNQNADHRSLNTDHYPCRPRSFCSPAVSIRPRPAAIARAEGFELYGHLVRLRPAASLRARSGAAAWPRAWACARHVTLDNRPAPVRRSALTAAIDVPKGRTADEMSAGIPITYVPARNTVFLSLALAYAEVLGAADIFHRRQRGRLQRLSRLPARVHRGLRADGEPGDQGRRRRHAASSKSTRR